MKKLILVLLMYACSLSSFGQDTVKARVKEYYLTFADFSPVTLQLKYKRQIGKRTYFKIGLINLSAQASSQKASNPGEFPTYHSGYSGGLELGIEFRKQLTKKFCVYHGPNLSFSYNKSISRLTDPSIPTSKQKSISQTYRGALPYTLGVLFNLNTNLLVSAEINPGITYFYQDHINGQNPLTKRMANYISIGFDNRFALLSIVYRL